MAARSARPLSATYLAAAALLLKTVIFAPLLFKKSLHWSRACSWATTSLTSESFTPGLASRQCSTFSFRLRTILQSYFSIRS